MTRPCNIDGENLECKQLTEMGGDDSLLTYGWHWEPTCTVDENYYDLCSLLTRNSSCIQGQVGCIIVSGLNDEVGRLHCPENSIQQGRIVTMATNSALLKHRQSDFHAEANAVCWCAKRGVPLEGCSAYVTIPPCKSCSLLLIMAGVRRVVTCLQGNIFNDGCSIHSVAKAYGVSLVRVPDTEERRMRRVLLGKMNEDRDKVLELRRERLKLRKEEKEEKRKKKRQLSSAVT